MPEPITTAMIVGALAWAFAEKAAGKMGEKAVENIGGSLWEKCKDLLKGDEIITLFPRASSLEDVRKELETKLDEKLAADPAARADLEEAFRQLPPQIKQNVMNITGSGNVGIQDVQGSNININK
jgi:hypothetical protein